MAEPKVEVAIGEDTVKKMMRNLKQYPYKENWNFFYKYTLGEVSCESNYNWRDVQGLIVNSILSHPPPPESESQYPVSSEVPAAEVGVLVAGCGNSALSESLYDGGFENITNVDFSDVVIKYMMKRNVRERPSMKWRVMDLANLQQFQNETFDAIVDIGGLDSVMDDPSAGYDSGHLYMSEVKRLLKTKGKYVCMTLGESRVIGSIFFRFRFGWKVNTYSILSENKNMFMVVAWKLADHVILKISSFRYTEKSDDSQALAFSEALKRENTVRKRSMDACNSFIPLEDLKANLKELEPGRIIRLTLGQPGASSYFYNCILLDAKQDYGPFFVQLLVFIVPNLSHLEWIKLSSKEQWRYVEHFKTARFLLVMVSPTNDLVCNEDIKKDVSRFVKKVAPVNCDDHKIMYVNAADGIKKKKNVHQVTSDLSGLIVVDDLIYDKDPKHHHIPCDDSRVRCLTVASMERSKALLKRERAIGSSSEVGKKKTHSTSKTKKGKHKSSHSRSSQSHGNVSSGAFKVDHSHLKSARHTAIISGLLLICVHLNESSVEGQLKNMFIGNIPLLKIKTVVIGLGAGLFPMFINNLLPYFTTEVVEADSLILDVARKYFDFSEDEGLKVVEADSLILDVARKYFDFSEDEGLKVHIADGIQFVKERANRIAAEGSDSSKIDVLIIDMDSPSPMPVLVSPPVDFIEQSFLLTVKNALSENGFLVINLVTRSIRGKPAIYGRLKKVFSNLIYLPIEEDISDVIFAFNSDVPTTGHHLSEACVAVAKSMSKQNTEWGQGIVDASKLFKPVIK